MLLCVGSDEGSLLPAPYLDSWGEEVPPPRARACRRCSIASARLARAFQIMRALLAAQTLTTRRHQDLNHTRGRPL
jgi:hypothetical protein